MNDSPSPAAVVRGSTAADPDASRARVAARSIAWQSVGTVVVQVAQAGITLTVAAIVSPRDFALLGIASVVLGAQWIIAGSLGLGLALIQADERVISRDAVNGAFTASAALGLATAAATFAAAPALGSLFQRGFSQSDVTDLFRVMSIVFLFAGLADVPQALVDRALLFRQRALVDIGSSLAYIALAVSLLLAGIGVWSVILARAAQSAVSFAGFLKVSPTRPHLTRSLDWTAIRRFAGYGKFVGASAIVTFVALNVDNVLVGSLTGAAALGAYALAYTIANVVPTFLTMTIGKVMFALYSAVRTDRAFLCRSLGGAVHLAGAVILPVTVVLATFAPAALVEIFGARWSTAGSLIRILSLYGFMRVAALIAVTFLNAVGKPQYGLRSSLTAALLPLAIVWPLSRGGAEGVGWSFTAGQAAAAVVLGVPVARWIDWNAVRGFCRPAVATVLGLAGALGADRLAPANRAGLSAVCVFAVVYAVALALVDADVRALVRRRGSLPLGGDAAGAAYARRVAAR